MAPFQRYSGHRRHPDVVRLDCGICKEGDGYLDFWIGDAGGPDSTPSCGTTQVRW